MDVYIVTTIRVSSHHRVDGIDIMSLPHGLLQIHRLLETLVGNTNLVPACQESSSEMFNSQIFCVNLVQSLLPFGHFQIIIKSFKLAEK